MRRVRILTADAFTDSPYAGNPCAVVPEAQGLSDFQMQRIAAEMNLSETSFVLPSASAAFRFRFFTPRTELPFAGHPTIATVAILYHLERLTPSTEETTFDIECGLGAIPVALRSDETDRPPQITMTQPEPTFGRTVDRVRAAAALELETAQLLGSVEPRVAGVGVPFLMIGVRDRETLLGCAPAWDSLRAVCGDAGTPAAYVFAPRGAGPEADLCARFLDPFAQYEDPFTGSACGAMAALAERAGVVEGTSFVVEQGESVGRLGRATVSWLEASGSLRVSGVAVPVLTGEMVVPSEPTKAAIVTKARSEGGEA